MLYLRIKKADKEIAEKLEIGVDDPYYAIRRLRLGDDKPLGLNLSRVPVSLCPALEKHDLTKGSLYSLIEEKYNHKVTKVIRIMETIPASEEIAKILKIKKGFPILSIIGLAYNQNRIPLDFCIEYYTD